MTVKSSNTTIREVARRAQVSVATVSRVLNHAAVVAPDTATRVQNAIAELNYTPRAAARNLATQQTHTIGLLMSEIAGDFFTPLLQGIESAAAEAGYDLLISTSTRFSSYISIPLPLGPHNTDGLLLFIGGLDQEALANSLQGGLQSGFPMVIIHQTPPATLAIPCVTIENEAASKELVEHLITVHRRRRIVFLKGPKDHNDSTQREVGYLRALRMYHIPFTEELVVNGEFNRNVSELAINRLLTNGTHFDAVFAGDDEAAIGVLAALSKAGRRVPADVSVVGFDDQRLSAYLTPPLTTVRAPTREVGYRAVQQLLELIRTGQAEPVTLLPTELVIRRSCGCNA